MLVKSLPWGKVSDQNKPVFHEDSIMCISVSKILVVSSPSLKEKGMTCILLLASDYMSNSLVLLSLVALSIITIIISIY